MNQIWVGSDWHLWNNHENYAHSYRSDTEIRRFIDKIDTLPIQQDDLVLFLGDFADIVDPNPYKIKWILDKIPGTKIMIYGNHDIEDMSYWLTAGFDGAADMVKIHHMIFTHFPIHVDEDYINFHGHLHTEKFSQLDARWVNVYDPDMPFTRLDDVLEKIRYNNRIATHTDVSISPFEAKGIKDTVDKYTNIMDLSDEFPLVPQDESVIKSQEDIYYNKEKFDSGEINLCFITGHRGSGKSTMGQDMSKNNIEHIELDDLQCIKDKFTLPLLKEYGSLIHSFFTGSGKKYYVSTNDLNNGKMSESEYVNKLYPDFVKFAKQYAKSHPNQKFVIEGIWLFYPRWFKPEEFKDYAFYIKGTSMIISMIRAAKRNNKVNTNTIDWTGAVKQLTNPKELKWYILDEQDLAKFINYFSKLTKQTTLKESTHQLNEVLFDDITDTEYWEQDDEHKLGPRKKEPMAEDYEEVKIKSTHEPRTKLKFLKEATEEDIKRLTEDIVDDYDSPEVEDDAFGGEEVRFFNREESYPTSTLDEEHHILTLDDSARFMNEVTSTKSSYKKLYPVYINLFSNDTVFGKLIKTVTGSSYTHATIGLDSTMNNMYSFSGIPYNTAPLFLCSGFVRESIWSPAFTRCAFFHTYVTFVDKEGRDKIQRKIDNFIKNYDKYDYNTPGLFEYYFGATNTKHHDENKKSMWFCSEFVTACINASDEIEGFEDIMQSPEDLAHMPNTFDLGEWHVEDFDQKKLDVLTKRAEAKFRKNPEMPSSILSEDTSGSWIMDESAREKLRNVYKSAQDTGREVYNKMRQHDVHKYVFNLDWKKLHDEFVRLFPKNSPATRFDLIGLILHSYLIPTKQPIENVTENIVNQFKEIKKTIKDGYIKLLDVAKSIIFFWNKKLKASALKYPSEELITESANEKYFTEPYSFQDKKYFKVTYNVLTGNTDTYYTDVSQSEDMLDNIIKIQPEDLDKLKIQFARDADELSTILATDYIKDTKLYQRIGALPISSDFNFSIFSLLRITSISQGNQEKYMESIRGLIPTDLTDEQFESYLLVRIKQLEEAMRFLIVLILENIALFGFTAADQARILSSGADRNDIKKAKCELDKQLLSNLTIDPKTGSVTYTLTSFGLGEIIISKNVYDENKDWLKPSRYLVRSANYDYIIAAHGHADNHDRWEIDPITINGKVYRYVDQLVHGLTKLGSSKVLIVCCNPNDYQLAEQFASIDGIEYCNTNVIMESVATTQYPSQLSKITDIELRKSIKAINVWRTNLLNLLDGRFDFICQMDVMTLGLSDDLSTVKLTTHSNTKPNNIKHLYASTINEILSLYGELLSAMRVLINSRSVNEGSYQVHAEEYVLGKRAYYPMTPTQPHTLMEAIQEARLQVLANYRQYSICANAKVIISESDNTVKSFPLYDIGNDRYLDPELHADPPADYKGLTEAATQKLYPVYVLLSHRSASVLSNAIKALTHSQFSHAALSFDSKLTHMYSFGRNSPNSSKGSFRLESIKKDAYVMGEVPYALYVVPCTAEQCKLIKKRLKYFAANKSNFTFDMAGLVKNGLGIESEPDDKWFCSRFVADVLNAGAPKGTKFIEHPSLTDPDDFRRTNFAQYVCGGLISDYDYLVTERITKDILHSSADLRSRVGHLKNENTNMVIPSYIKYHNQVWHYKYANDPEEINYTED